MEVPFDEVNRSRVQCEPFPVDLIGVGLYKIECGWVLAQTRPVILYVIFPDDMNSCRVRHYIRPAHGLDVFLQK